MWEVGSRQADYERAKRRMAASPQAASYKPLTTYRPFPIPRARPAGPAEIRGPCRTNRQDSVAAALLATSYALRAAPSPPPRTTYYVPRTNRADKRVRPYGGRNAPRVTSRNYRPQAAGHLPLFRHSSQANLGWRELENGPE